MRIATFCSNYPPHPGGLEAVVQNVAARLAQHHEVTLVTSAWKGCGGRTEEDGMVVYRLPTIHRTERWGVPYPVPYAGLREATRAVRDAELIHAHGALYAATMAAARLAGRLGVPLALTEHVGFVDYRSNALNLVQKAAWRTIGEPVMRAAAALTVYNTRVLQWLTTRLPNTDIRFIANGVDVRRFSPASPPERITFRRELGLPEQDRLVLCVARNAEKKNLDVVLNLPRDSYTLVVCGAQRGLRLERVVDLGVLPHTRMHRLFGAVDILIHASSGEGFPLAVQEGMAAGVPLVLLWDTGYSRTLDPQVIEPARSLDGLHEALMRLLSDPSRRAALSRVGRDWAVRHWDWALTASAYEQLFHDLVSSSVRKAADNAEARP